MTPVPHPPRPAPARGRQPRRSPQKRSRLTRRARTLRALGVPLLLTALVTAGAPGWSTYLIRPGDTLHAIAAQHGTTVQRLVRVNDLQAGGHLIYAGETLRIPRSGAATPHTGGQPRQADAGGVSYVVQLGDSLSDIAARFGTDVETLAARNRLASADRIYEGQVLRIGTGASRQRPRGGADREARGGERRGDRQDDRHERRGDRDDQRGDGDGMDVRDGKGRRGGGATFLGRTYPAALVAAAARNRARLAHADLPAPQRMRRIIVATSRRYGVGPNLALAISWQESGWDQSQVSVANAIGAMQVIPSTGEWISSVVGRELDLLRPRDNVTAGVALLDVLLDAAPLRRAVAGYYQGLAGVREHGMYDDTRIYVANVLALRSQLRRGKPPSYG